MRECFKGDEASQWKRPKFDPTPCQNKKIGRRDNVVDGTRHAKFVAIGSGVSAPQIRDFALFLGWLVFFFVFGFFSKATAYIPKRIFTQNTSEDVVPGKKVPFGGSVHCVQYLDPKMSDKLPFWEPILTEHFFAVENRFNMGMLEYKLPLIVIVAP